MNLLSLLGACLLSVGVGGVALQEKISTTTNDNQGYTIINYSQSEDLFRKHLESMNQGASSSYTMLLSYYGNAYTYSLTYAFGSGNNNLDLEYIVLSPFINNVIPQYDYYFCVVDCWDTLTCDGYSWSIDTWSRYYFYIDRAFDSYSFFIDWGIYQNYLFDSPNAVVMWNYGTQYEIVNIQNPSSFVHYNYNPYDEIDFQDKTRLGLISTSNSVECELVPVGFHTDDNELTFYNIVDDGLSFVYTKYSYAKLSSLQTIAYNNGYNQGFDDGKQVGYQEGLQASGYSFLDLFGAVADTPVIMVRNLFSFDLFGVSALTIIMTMFTALILFYIFRKIV